MVEAADIAEEIVFIQQSRELVALRVADQVTVLGQLDAFGNAGLDDLNIRKRLRDKVHRADAQAVKLRLLIHGQDDHRDRHQFFIDLHLREHLPAGHVRHDQVKQHKVDLSGVAAQHLQGFGAVRGVVNIIIPSQQVAEDLTVHFDVVGDQNGLAHVDRGDVLRHPITL